MSVEPRRTSRTAVAAAETASELLTTGEPLKHVWRYVIVQLLDDYTTALQHRGLHAAAALWSNEPPSTGDQRVDAAFAAMAEHLARRDGWPVPPWAFDPRREAGEWWFVTDLQGLWPRALVESPLSFRKRGIFITSDALVRV